MPLYSRRRRASSAIGKNVATSGSRATSPLGTETLTGIEVDQEIRLEPDNARLLSRWIAERYTRPAFPDAFNARLDTVAGRLERLYKSQEGEIVTGVFLEVADDEIVDCANHPYHRPDRDPISIGPIYVHRATEPTEGHLAVDTDNHFNCFI